MSGFSDPIYAEAYVKMNGFDILLGEHFLEANPFMFALNKPLQTFSW